jgi:hypothetical protein
VSFFVLAILVVLLALVGDNRGRLSRRPALVNRSVERDDPGEGATLIEPFTVSLGDAQNLLPGGTAHGEACHLLTVQAAQDYDAWLADYVQAVPRRDVHRLVVHGCGIG